MYKYAEVAPLEVGEIENMLETLRAAAQQAKRATEVMQLSSAAIHPR